MSAERLAVPDPVVGEVRLRVECCGLCGSDLHIYHSDPDRVRAGMTLGHEMVGIVDAVGDGVDGWRLGDRVTVEPLLSCGRCELCAAGYDNRCREYGLIGLHRPGGFAERVVVPARRLYAVPAALDRRVAALAEPVAVCVHGLRLGRLRPPSASWWWAPDRSDSSPSRWRGRGARDIAITAGHPHQARVARELGATVTLDPLSIRGEPAGKAAASAGAFPLVVETIGGHADTLLDATVTVAPGGRILVLGVFQEMVRLDPWPLLLKEATLTWSLCYTRPSGDADFEEAVRLLAAHPDVFARVLTHEVPLRDVDRAFALADDKSSGAVKVSVTP